MTPAADGPRDRVLAGRPDGRRRRSGPDVPLPAALTGGAPTIGLRVPGPRRPAGAAAGVGPLPTTSANVSGLPEARDADGDRAQLGDAIDLILDGGVAHGGPASTVVDCTGATPASSRGAIPSARQLRRSSMPRRIAHDLPVATSAKPRPAGHPACASRLVRIDQFSDVRNRPAGCTASAEGDRRPSYALATQAGRSRTTVPMSATLSFVGRYAGARRREGWPGRHGRSRRTMTISPASGLALESIAEVDPVLWEAMLGERRRQHDKIELIASENYISAAVMEAQGSWLTNKYAEGLPGKRYYGGCEYVDIAERLAQERALALFPGAEHVNVQPHSGAQANMAAYFSVLEPGDRIMGMNLAHGGHLTHGMALNFSGRLYEVHAYGVRQDTERIDYDAMAAQAREVRPKLIVGGASAYPRTWDFERMAEIAADVGALLFIDMAHVAGPRRRRRPPEPVPARGPRHDDDPQDPARTARRDGLQAPVAARRASTPRRSRRSRTARTTARWPPRSTATSSRASRAARSCRSSPARPSRSSWPPRRPSATTSAGPIENAAVLAETLAGEGARVVSGGTDNHLMLVDVTPLGVTGKEAEHLLDEIGITVNKNAIPFDTLPPNTASGIRDRDAGHDVARVRAGRDARRSAGSSSRRSDDATSRRPGPPGRRGPRDREPVPGPGAARRVTQRERRRAAGDRRASMTFISAAGIAVGPILVVFVAAAAARPGR